MPRAILLQELAIRERAAVIAQTPTQLRDLFIERLSSCSNDATKLFAHTYAALCQAIVLYESEGNENNLIVEIEEIIDIPHTEEEATNEK